MVTDVHYEFCRYDNNLYDNNNFKYQSADSI